MLNLHSVIKDLFNKFIKDNKNFNNSKDNKFDSKKHFKNDFKN